ncbi:uncharacterized protein LOC144607284 [Rhinoraja longicauda]
MLSLSPILISTTLLIPRGTKSWSDCGSLFGEEGSSPRRRTLFHEESLCKVGPLLSSAGSAGISPGRCWESSQQTSPVHRMPFFRRLPQLLCRCHFDPLRLRLPDRSQEGGEICTLGQTR